MSDNIRCLAPCYLFFCHSVYLAIFFKEQQPMCEFIKIIWKKTKQKTVNHWMKLHQLSWTRQLGDVQVLPLAALAEVITPAKAFSGVAAEVSSKQERIFDHSSPERGKQDDLRWCKWCWPDRILTVSIGVVTFSDPEWIASWPAV